MVNDDYTTPKLGVVPMTVIAFQRESENTLLLSADSQYSMDGFRIFHSKLKQVPNQCIAWASDGNPSIGEQFASWLKKDEFSKKNWDSFSSDAKEKWAELNGQQKRLTRLAGADEEEDNVTSIALIVGLIAGEMGAYVFSKTGIPYNVLGHNFHAIGDGTECAFVARTAIEMYLEKSGAILDCEAKLWIVMNTVAKHRGSCHTPIDMWRISKNSVEECKETMASKNEEKPLSPKQFHKILGEASQPIKKSDSKKS